MNFLLSMLAEPGFGADDTLLAVTTLSFDISVLEMFLPLVAGGTVVIADRDDVIDGRRLATLVETSGATVMQATPTTWSMLFDAGWSGRPGLRVLCGGEAMPLELARRLVASCGAVWNMFGPTETTVWSTICRLDERVLASGVVPIGRPIAGTVVRVLSSGQLVGIGAPGDLLIGGAGVARGYLGRDDLTADRFIDDPFLPGERLYRTGDVARWRHDGTLEYLGRSDAQVKVRGFRIELGEIEAVLRELDGIRDAVVIADGTASTARLLAYYIPTDPDQPLSISELRQWIRDRLPDYMVPARFIPIDAFPLTPNRKIDRNALPRPDRVSFGALDVDVQPRSQLEWSLAAIWCDVLRLEHVGVNRNFFDLGGHSLLAMRLVSRIESDLGFVVAVRSIFDSPTIEQLAGSVEAGASAGGVAELVGTVDRSLPLPSSFAQERMWFLDQLVPDPSAYHIAVGARLRGALDVTAFAAAVDALVRRHESLRTRLVADAEGVARAVIDPPPSNVLQRFDLRDVPVADRVSRASTMIDEQVHAPMDLAVGPIFRSSLFVLADDEHLLLTVVHHAMADQWSLGVIGHDLTALYNASMTGSAPSLDEISVEYVDFAAWQRSTMRGAELERQLAYWRPQLLGVTPLNLPLDRPRPPMVTYAGTTITRPFPSDVWVEIDGLSRRSGVTPFVTLLAAFQLLLGRYGDQDDVAVAVPAAHRRGVHLERIVGNFVNTLVMRADLSDDVSFVDLIGHVQITVQDALAHQDLPFETVVAELSKERDLSRGALAQVMFNMYQPSFDAADLHGLESQAITIDRRGSQFDISLLVVAGTELGERMIVVEYNTDVFDASTIERLVDHWLVLLRAATDDPKAPIASLPMLSIGEEEVLRGSWAGAVADQPTGADLRVEQLVSRRSSVSPEARAVTCGDEDVTYAELHRRANQLAHHLIGRGVGRGDRVGIACDRSVGMVVAVLAVLKTGAAYVPLDPSYPADRLTLMIADSDVRLLIVSDGSLVDRLAMTTVSCLHLEHDRSEIDDQPELEPTTSGDASDAAYVFYTSGSTGAPKGVEVEHRSVVNFLRAMLVTPSIGPDDVLLAVTSLSFDPSVLDIFVPLIAGAAIVIATRDDMVDGHRLGALIASSRATMMQATPTTWSMLFDAGWAGEKDLVVLCGGEVMRQDLARRLLETCSRVWNVFGPTETTVWSTVFEVVESSLDRRTVPIGRPIANQIVRVVDSSGRPVPVGVPGELLIGGLGVARGYVNRSALTDEQFVDDPLDPGHRVYRTGDIVRWRSDGNLEYIGRTDFQVKIRGHRIELGEVESVLQSHGSITHAVVIADGTASTARLLAYYVIADPGQPLSTSELRQWIHGRLPDYMVPARFIPIDAFPLTPNRKIDRNALPRPDRVIVDSVEHIAPRNDVERVVAGIVGQTLQVGHIGVLDNFFELGGHSLHATSVLAKVSSFFDVQIDLRSFFTDPTVAAVSALLVDNSTSPSRIERIAQLHLQLDAMSPEEVASLLAVRRASSEEGDRVDE